MSVERVKTDKITTDENRQPKKEVRINLLVSVCVCGCVLHVLGFRVRD